MESLQEKEVKQKLPITINEIINDDLFKKNVATELERIKLLRLNRPTLNPDLRYKRDWYDQLVENGSFTLDYFIENIQEIWIKKSNVNSKIRSIILSICNNAYVNTLDYYSKQSI